MSDLPPEPEWDSPGIEDTLMPGTFVPVPPGITDFAVQGLVIPCSSPDCGYAVHPVITWRIVARDGAFISFSSTLEELSTMMQQVYATACAVAEACQEIQDRSDRDGFQ